MGNGEWGMGNGEWIMETRRTCGRLAPDKGEGGDTNAKLLNKTYDFFKENRG
jgi:hypothetical protein